MALPDEPKTDTSSAPPPPNLPPNVRVSSPAQTISNRRIPDISDPELVAAFKDKPLYVLDRVNWNRPKSPYRQRLEDLIAKDPSLQKILDHVLPVYPQATPQPKPQAAPAVVPGAPPPVTAAQIVKPAAQPAPGNNITAKNAPKIQEWLNNLKPKFYEYMADKKFDAATSAHVFTESFLEYLAMYKGGLAGFYLSQGAYELLFSALGPIGDALGFLHQKDMKRKVAWMKNPLNPNALYYYLNVLPEENAFKLLFLPVKATWGILARGGAPLITKATYQERDPRHRDYGQIKQGYFFSPFLKASQASLALADRLEKTAGLTFDKQRFDSFEEQVNWNFNKTLIDLKNAKISGDKKVIKAARNNIKNQLNLHDGKFGQAIFRNGLKNLSRRLRHSSQDPITGIFALIVGTLFDISVGFLANIARVAATKIINAIPGLNTLRAQAVEFFSSNRFLNTARIGGATTSSFIKGVFSPTTFSSGYLGYNLFPNSPLAQGILTPTFAGAGAFYNTALKMAANPGIINWIYKYDDLLFKATDSHSSVAQQNFYRGELEKNFLNIDSRVANFRPGPFSNFAKWLYEHPLARLPINGFVIADLGVKFLGWNPWVAYPSFIAGDYLWQVKGELTYRFASWFKTTPIYKLYYSKVFLPVNTWFSNLIYEPMIAEGSIFKLGVQLQRTLRPWANSLSKYLGSFFNPGFFAGFGLIPMMTPVIGAWGYVLGPLAGSAAYLLGSRALIAFAKGVGIKSIGGISIAGKFGLNALPQINAWSWLGMGVGWVLDLIIPGAQPWLVPLFTYGLPVVLTLFPGLGSLFSGLLVNIGYFASNVAWALGISLPTYAAWAATWATITSIAAVAGLTVFFAYTIYAGFWVPFQQVNQAGPESTFFSTQTTVTNSNGQVDICSTINVKQDLLTEVNYINHLVYNVFSALTITDFDYRQPNRYVTKATRQNPGSGLVNLAYLDSVSCPGFTNKNYSASFDADFIPLPSLVGLPVHNTYLSTFTSCETGKKTIFELQQMFPQSYGLQQISNGYIDFLNQINEDRNDGNNDNDTKTKLEATLDVINKTIAKFDDVVKLVKDASNQDNLASLQEKISRAYELTETASKPENNPFIGKYDSFEAFQANCNYQESTCRKIYGIYQSYSTFFQSQLSTLTTLKKSADNPSANLAELKKQIEKAFYSLNSALQDLKTQKQSTQDAKDTAIDLYGDDGFWNDWLSILTNISGSQLTEIQNMLLVAVQDVFKKKFYFTPARTVYEVCLKTKWIRPDLLPYTFPVVVYFTNPPAMFNYNYFSPTVNFYTIPAP